MSKRTAAADRPAKAPRPAKAKAEPKPVPVTTGPGVELHGEIITWSMKGAAVPHSELVAALVANGLPTDVIREMLPRHAFSRACGKLRDERIIRKVDEDEAAIRFQFTSERRTPDGFDYDLETILTLSKADGAISCDIEALAIQAEEAFNAAMGLRTPSDVTTVVQRLFAREADLFSIREQGGCYFVPRDYADLVDRVQSFLVRLNGTIGRFPVPKGTATGDASVKVSVAEGLADMVNDHMEAIASFDISTLGGTMERRAEAIRVTRHKLLAYADYLGSEKDRLEAVVDEAADLLRARVEVLSAEKEAIRGPEAPKAEVPAEVAARRSAAAFKAHATRLAMKAAAEAEAATKV